ncbi:MAG: pyridoxine 5'-phosphate synthase [Lacipirellulaceae bacterium]
MALLGVNIDHVATVRQARRALEPDPVWAAALAELAGADGITVHLREDRRHIQDRDVEVLLRSVAVPVNLECACADEVLGIACRSKPHQVTLVPERREEVTTEGGLDVAGGFDRVRSAVDRLHREGIRVSLFIDADPQQLSAAASLGVNGVELHTGPYAHAFAAGDATAELARLASSGKQAVDAGMQLHAGHGLNYRNIGAVAALANMAELNIGHSIVARALFVGFDAAVREMKRLIAEASR